VLYGVGRQRRCALCGFTGWRFAGYGSAPKKRKDVRCPACGSLERHRLAHRMLSDELGPGQRTLHVAPEPSIYPWLRRISSDYLSIDLEREAMLAMDLMQLELPDADRTLVWCSHVLEHVDDDGRAMAEIYRVLRPGGRAVIQVPIAGDETFEDASIRGRAERTAAFLQWDHVRLYGLDIVERLRAAGFTVAVKRLAQLPRELVQRERLDFHLTNEVFVCQRPA
jgi:SAM-dependent methyltransferase